MNQSPRILPDLLAPMNDFVRKSDQVIDPVAMDYLAKRHPDGVRVIDIASYHGLLFLEAHDIVEIALCARQLKARRDQDGDILFVWRAGTMPPLSGLEKTLLRQAQRDLDAGPDRIFVEGAAMDLRVGPAAVRKALEFLVSADLLTRDGRAYALTPLGRTEGDPE
ncbi:hypothetical protein FIU93_21270 [Labrenzia sp. THAF35]|uniref:hypothetical protein n=1 Tax=Labrenzia sp. THAF35 TaxID=2587854 RepID=UPI001268A2D8|nr:hypothetical protein [Labrenzia sp. THAF35]QFT69331.1 hypothetical protein FIU93_21270 [Labrenzia sp. THAF35]